MHDLLGCGKNIYELNEDSKPQLNVHFKEKNEMKFFLSLNMERENFGDNNHIFIIDLINRLF